MANDLPAGLSVARNLELTGRESHPWIRRSLLVLIAVLPVLALLNFFGQRPTVSLAHAGAADLKVTAPARLRSGLIFQVRIEVIAHRDIQMPQLVLNHGWWESMSENSVEPQPSTEGTRNGNVTFSFAKLPAGHRLIMWLYFQVNPTNVGNRAENVELDDGATMITNVHRSLTIFP
jgi:hypothetical protein